MSNETRKQWTLVGLIVAGLVLGAFALVTFGQSPEGVEVGKRAPDFKAIRLVERDTITFHREYDGKVTLVNIWATWCAPCREEMPAIERLYQEFAPRGFRVVAVSVDDGNGDDVRAYVQELGLSFDVLHDPSGEIERIYLTTGVPESFLLDRDGVIVKKVIGAHPWSSPANQRIVADLLGSD